MSLLTICQEVCDEVGLPRPSTVVGSTDPFNRQLLALANAALRETSKRHDWKALETLGSENVVALTAAYALESDFRSYIPNTAFDTTNDARVRGSVSLAELQARNQTELLLGRYTIRFTRTQMVVAPTPQEAFTVSFYYRSKNYAQSSAGVAKSVYALDNDVSRVDEDLIKLNLKWRLKHAKGLEYLEDQAEYEALCSLTFAQEQSSPDVHIGATGPFGTWPIDGPDDGYIPETGFGV